MSDTARNISTFDEKHKHTLTLSPQRRWHLTASGRCCVLVTKVFKLICSIAHGVLHKTRLRQRNCNKRDMDGGATCLKKVVIKNLGSCKSHYDVCDNLGALCLAVVAHTRQCGCNGMA